MLLNNRYPKEEILGRNCRFLQGKHTDPKTVQAIRDAIKAGSKLEIELLNYRKDGIPFLNGFCMLPLHETGKRDGKVMYFLAIQKNVTVIVNPWRAPINRWTVPEVCMWLDKNGGGSYAKGFLQRDVNGAMLENMSLELLEQCGVVLTSEQNRILRLLQNEKALRVARGEQYGVGDANDPSMDDSTSMQSVSASQSRHDISRSEAGNSRVIQLDDEDESLSEASNYKNSSKTPDTTASMRTKGKTARKTVLQATFRNDLRPTVNIIVSSASTNIQELRRVLRKKTGRKFEVQSMQAPEGLTSKLQILLEPTLEGLDLLNFAVLDGIVDPILVTDNLGIIVFANDAAWSTFSFGDDPVDTYILDHLKTSVNKIDFVRDLRSNKLAVTTKDASKFTATFNPVTIGKCKLFVWAFVP